MDHFPLSPASSPLSSQGLVFTFWLETAESAAKRGGFSPDRLAATLRAHPGIDPIVLINPFRSGPRQLVKRALGRSSRLSSPSKEVLVSPLRLRHREVTGHKALSRAYAAYDRWVERAATRAGLRKPPIIITNPFYAAYAPLSWAGPVTYYGWDDWAALPAVQAWWPDYIDAYSHIRSRGFRVCAVAKPLLDRIDPKGPGIVVPNGVAPEEWATPSASPDWLNAFSRPLILYAGAIHPRLNVQDIRLLSKAFPDGTILLIGPVSSPEIVSQLDGMDNVVVKPPVPRREIAGVIRGADVCIMPHHVNELTLSMSPLKIYEYCAAGRPSVATDLPAVRGIDEHVTLVPEGGSFPDAVRQALHAGAMTEPERLSFIEANTWGRRHAEIIRFATADQAALPAAS